MSGSDQSARLQGLLSGIAGTVGELGSGGEWAGNAIRTIARPDFMAGSDRVLGKYGNPEFDMNNVDNLYAMGNWASRNGYDEQAEQYMAMGAAQQKVQGKKSYADQLAIGTEKLNKLHAQRNTITSNPQADPSAITAIDAQITAVENTLNEAGASNIYGTATDGALASKSAVTSILAQEKAALEQRNLLAKTQKSEQDVQALIDEGRTIGVRFLPHINYAEYERRMEQAQTNSEKIRINKSYIAMNKGFAEARSEQNKTIAGQQVRVIYRDIKNEGKGFINDDNLTDFLQELSEEDRQILDSVVVANALSDPEWINGDPEAQRQIVKNYFVDQYTRFYKDDFGKAFGEREGGKALEQSDAIADYSPGMNPDLSAEQGGGMEAFESFYENAVLTDPTFTREEAREMWDQEHRIETPFYTGPETAPGYLGTTSRAGRPVRQPEPNLKPATGNFANKAGR